MASKDPLKVAEAKIRKAIKTNATGLHLSGLGLTALPESLGQLTHLQELYLQDNQLTALPDSLSRLTQLQKLVLAVNQLTALPDFLGQLTQLRVLYLDGNKLTALPDFLSQLTQLQGLYLHRNQLTALPDFLGQLTQLRVLYLDGNQLTALPDFLGQLTQLRGLYLQGNQLTALPDFLGQLTQLQKLSLGVNQLTAVPDFLGQLTQLQGLSLHGNQLTALPDSLGQLTRLEKLFLDRNQLTALPDSLKNCASLTELYLHNNHQLGIPADILGPSWRDVAKGAQPASPAAILDYYFRTRGEARELREGKLILVGHGGVGKSSLVDRLLYKRFDKDKAKTEGIAIEQWPVQVCDGQVRLHIWDFGGQEIMHATHQFFLTRRSLYLLVLSGREGHEDQDIEYWLKLIESFGGDESPVIVVQNKIDAHPFELNMRALRGKYPQIREFIKTDCESGAGIDGLREAVCAAVGDVPGVYDRFPANWFGIKDRLAGMPDNYLSFERYREICAESGEADPEAQERLAGYLHCLGIALNYRDDPRLSETSVLNPRWATEGVYGILNHKMLAESHGELRLRDLKRMLPLKDYPGDKHHFLMELMRKFQLSFTFPEDLNHYLIPDLLPKEEPDVTGAFDPAGCLNFEYHYEVLPEGLLPRFIVRTAPMSEGQARWRSGVVLAWEGCRALVKADAADKRVTIRVQGESATRRRELLAVIRTDFERIHTTITKLPVTEMVPLPEYPQISVGYRDLLAYEAVNEECIPIVVDGKLEKFNVKTLLHGIDVRRVDMAAARVFISYAHKDESLREQLDTHLKLLHRQGVIETWHDRRIAPGESWAGVIDLNLEQADIILLLISADFLASDYCYDREMTRAVKRHAMGEAVVIPVMLRDAYVSDAPFMSFQGLPRDMRPVTQWEDRDAAWRNVAEGIARAAKAIKSRGDGTTEPPASTRPKGPPSIQSGSA